jgi:hypothetical protein
MSGNPPIVTNYSKLPTTTTVLGGPFNGYSPQQTINNFKDSDVAMTRRILRDSWNNVGINGSINNYGRIITPFRSVNNLGDYLSRKNYVCHVSNQVNASKPGMKHRIGSIINSCDGTGILASSGNMRYVPDTSDYTRYKKQRAISKNYNDVKNGGDESRASCVAFKLSHM